MSPENEAATALASARSSTSSRLWSADSAFRRRAINIGHLLSGNGVNALLGLIGIAITARSLGPGAYGALALIVSYVRFFDRLMRFESWQPLIKYAVDSRVEGEERRERLRDLFAFGFRLDIAACMAAAASAGLLALALAPLIGLNIAYIGLVLVHCASLMFNISGTPTAILRLSGRFRTIAYIQVSNGACRILLCGLAAWSGGGLLAFVLAWTASQIVSSLLFIGAAMVELRRQGVTDLHCAPCHGVNKRFPGIMAFAWSSSLSMSIRSSSMELDVLIVGGLADASSAGLYFVAKQIAKMVQQVCAQVQAVLYPDVARLWAERAYDLFHRAVVQTQCALDLFLLAAIAVLALWGRHLVELILGPRFGPAYPLLLVQLVALLFTVHAAPLRSSLLAMGKQYDVLRTVLIATLIFHALALSLVPLIGAMGANIAHVALAAVSAGMMEWSQRRGFRSADRGKEPQPGSD